jgi:hypothetical protein
MTVGIVKGNLCSVCARLRYNATTFVRIGAGGPPFLNLLFLSLTTPWVPLDKSEGPVKTRLSLAMREHRFVGPRKFVDEDTGKHLYLNHLSVESYVVGYLFMICIISFRQFDKEISPSTQKKLLTLLKTLRSELPQDRMIFGKSRNKTNRKKRTQGTK